MWGENQILFSLHTGQSWKYNQHKTRIEDEEDYHIYAMDWSKDKIDFFVDNNLVYTFNPENKTEAFGLIINPSFFIVNLAIGGSFGGPDDSIFPQDFSVDYIRVYQ
jgi:beta-glucanase (GH16 family)